MKRICSSLVCCACFAATLIVSRPNEVRGRAADEPKVENLSQNCVVADFGVSVDNPLIKTKFNLFNTTIPSILAFDRDIKLISELNPESMRMDFAWGWDFSLSHAIGGTAENPTYDFTRIDHMSGEMLQRNVLPQWAWGWDWSLSHAIGGTAENPTYDFTRIDHMSGEMLQRNVLPLWTLDYTPDPLLIGRRSPISLGDLEKWREIVTTVARHFHDSGIPLAAYETWNEPDNSPFFAGTEADFQKLYIATVQAIKAGDPDGVIAGPTVAWSTWYKSFPEFVKTSNLPLDVFTFHHYGSPALRETTEVADSLARFPYFNTTEMGMDEYHSADCCIWYRGDVQDKYEAAAQLLHDFNVFLTHPELTSVSWAQFQEPCDCRDQFLGLITLDGFRKAAFNGFKIYATMPVDRKQVTVSGPAMEAMASSDDHKAGLVILNQTTYERRVDVTLKNIPFSKGNVRIYRIDHDHSSWGDGAGELLKPSETFMNVDTVRWAWTGPVPRGAVIYFEAEDGKGLSELSPVKVARVIRVHHYYPSRGTSSYADFDRKTWIARLGMANNQFADQEVGATVEELPSTLDVAVKVEGKLLKLDANSLLGVRVDYMVDGSYAKGILFHGAYDRGADLYDKDRTAPMPWGTKRQPDQVVAVVNLASFQIKPAEYAPANWRGRVQITFILQNSGVGTRAQIIVRTPQSTMAAR